MARNEWTPLTATGPTEWTRVERGPVGISFKAGGAGAAAVEVAKTENPDASEVVKLTDYGADTVPPDIYDATEDSEFLRFNVTTGDAAAKGRFSQKGRST